MAAAARIARSAFQVPRKGETFELRNGLVSQYAYERKEAIQKTIAAMTLGKDVSALFPDVLKNIATHDLGQKKLVYLYLMNYAKSHPELCILAVNTFVQDSEDPNPLVRALAIRTMGCIRVDKMVDYLGEPLRKTLKDESPYVRKTAVICVAKLFDLNPSMCVENGFLEMLQDMVNDANPMVVANAIQALGEIQESAPELNAFDINGKIHTKLLVALNECTEWGRVTLLEALSKYRPTDVKDAEHVCERVVPQFQHQNASVVMAAVKVVMLNLNNVSPEMQKSLVKKMGPPLVTMVSSAPEVQYVALRNISLILQKQPDILSKEWRIFCCRFNDPDYLKHEKLDIMVKLANDKNVDQLLLELKEYASEIDVDFVRRAVRAIGQCALKIPEASERSINVLLDLVNTKVNYVVQEAVCVIKDILRKYPHRYENVIPTLAENLDALDDPAARASLIWMIGEYAEKITNAGELLETFLESFKDEPTSVQLQLLTATVKLFLKKGSGAQDLVTRLLKTATSECDNPDIRDRAYVYWRLLSASGQVAKTVVLSEKPPINANQQVLSPRLLDELIGELGSLASVYHKPADSFVGKGRFGADAVQRRAIEEQIQNARENPIQAQSKSNIENLLDLDLSGGMAAGAEDAASPTLPNATPTSILDELGSLSLSTTTSPPPGPQVMSPPLSGVMSPPTQVASPPPRSQFTSHGPPANAPANNMDDLLGIFGGGAGEQNGAFGGANVWSDIPPQNGAQTAKKPASSNEDILGLF